MDQSVLIRRAALHYAHKPAIVFQGRAWTFAEVNERANRLANGLLGLGVRKGDRVATLRTNCPEHVEMLFALFKIGAVAVSINPRLSPAEMAWQIGDSGASALIMTEELLPLAASLRAQVPAVGHYVATGAPPAPFLAYEDLLARSSPTEPEMELRGDDLADLGYTSGTTGRPKGTLRDRAGWLAVDRNVLLDLVSDLTDRDTFLAAQPLYHGAGRFVLPCWIRGVTQVIIPNFEPDLVLETIERHGVSVMKTVPTVLVRLLADPTLGRRRLSTVRTIVYGASPMPVDRLRQALQVFGPVFVQLYGQAEAPLCITYLGKGEHVVDGPNGVNRLASAGRPFTMCEVRVVDDEGRDVPVGEPGEVIVRGDHLMRGYWNVDPEITRQTLRDGWVYTRDIGRLDAEGYLYLMDRKSEMIISGGLNVYPNEVEQVLYTHPAVLEAAIIGRPDPVWGEVVKACVALRPGAQATAQELIDFCATRTAGYKKPRLVEFFELLPKTGTNKIARRELRERERQAVSSQQ